MEPAPDVEQRLMHLMSRKGQIVTIVTERDCAVRKNNPQVRKRSEFQCRVGVAYDRIKAVQEKRAQGELPFENAGLLWGEWVVFPYVITHKGELYVRCTALHNTFRRTPVYSVNGMEISRAEAEQLCLASEFRPRRDFEVFTVRVSNILSIK